MHWNRMKVSFCGTDFSKWYETGEGPDYRYWEETVIRDLKGNLLETLPGDIRIMPNGELWYLK